MLDDEARDLGARFVACEAWRWMPGMRGLSADPNDAPARVVMLPMAEAEGGSVYDRAFVSELVPDPRDAATLGAILALVREVWGDPSLAVVPVDESIPLAWALNRKPRWTWRDGGLESPMSDADAYWSEFATEAHALLAALEARGRP